MEHENTQVDSPALKPGRQADRFNIELPVELDNSHGLTRNICATGIYFETEAVQTPGSHVRFTVEVTIRGEKSKMVCEGEVVRVENKDGVVGVAVALSNSFFSSNGPIGQTQPAPEAAKKTGPKPLSTP